MEINGNKTYQSNKYYMAENTRDFQIQIYGHKFTPAGVHNMLDTVKVIVKEVDVEMEVVVIQ